MKGALARPKPAIRSKGPNRYTAVLVATTLVVGLAGAGASWAGSLSSTRLEASGPHPAPLPPGGLALPSTSQTTTGAPSTARPQTTKRPAAKARAAASKPVPLPSVLSVSPANGAAGVGLAQAIRVTLSGPARRGAPMPVLQPAVFGSWAYTGKETLVFRPYVGYQPWAKETVMVPAGLAKRSKSYTFATTGVPIARVQQLLAELHYLPLRFTGPTGQYADEEPTKAALVPPAVEPGSFSWSYKDIPPQLSSLWQVGQDNVITVGAIMHFESVSGLPSDGVAGPDVWAALTSAAAQRSYDPAPYDYLIASEVLPEKLEVWRDGSYIYQTLVNTGVTGATTQPGTFPVYARYPVTEMKGTDPDGEKYDIPDVPWVAYFNGGDAVHGFPRYSYGWPQSNGCVELPIANAEVVFGMDPIGTLVTVTTGPLPTPS